MIVPVNWVMQAWSELVSSREPWSSMPLDDRSGELRPLLEELLDTSGGIDSPIRRRRIRSVAARHGVFRRRQRCSSKALGNDFVAVSRALQRALSGPRVMPELARYMSRVLLPDIVIARQAARMAHAKAYGRLENE